MKTETGNRLPAAAATGAAVVLAHLLGVLALLDAPERLASFHEGMDGVAATLHILLTAGAVAAVAFLLRGGRLARVWWMMGASGVTWLVYDVAEALAAALPGDASHTLELLEVLRTAGMVLTALAGWMQREALAPRRAPDVGPVLPAPSGAR